MAFGFIFLLPLLLLSFASLRGIWKRWETHQTTRAHRVVFWICLCSGALLGLFATLKVEFTLGNKTTIHGFPIPIRFENPPKEKDRQAQPQMPVWVSLFAGSANILLGSALGSLPLWITSYLWKVPLKSSLKTEDQL